jgi:DnaJ-class molecular chaperone
MATKDPYTVLGVKRDTNAKEIKKAYRKLVRKYHPDINPGNKEAEERFKEISAAFEVLSEPDKRKVYDEFGEDGLRSGFDPEQARAYRDWQSRAQATSSHGNTHHSPREAYSEFDLGDILSGFGFADAGPATTRKRRGQDISSKNLRHANNVTVQVGWISRRAPWLSVHRVWRAKAPVPKRVRRANSVRETAPFARPFA